MKELLITFAVLLLLLTLLSTFGGAIRPYETFDQYTSVKQKYAEMSAGAPGAPPVAAVAAPAIAAMPDAAAIAAMPAAPAIAAMPAAPAIAAMPAAAATAVPAVTMPGAGATATAENFYNIPSAFSKENYESTPANISYSEYYANAPDMTVPVSNAGPPHEISPSPMSKPKSTYANPEIYQTGIAEGFAIDPFESKESTYSSF